MFLVRPKLKIFLIPNYFNPYGGMFFSATRGSGAAEPLTQQDLAHTQSPQVQPDILGSMK